MKTNIGLCTAEPALKKELKKQKCQKKWIFQEDGQEFNGRQHWKVPETGGKL